MSVTHSATSATRGAEWWIANDPGAVIRGTEAELDRLDVEIIGRLRLQAEETRAAMRRLGLDHLAEAYEPQAYPRPVELRSSRHPSEREIDEALVARRLKARELRAERERLRR